MKAWTSDNRTGNTALESVIASLFDLTPIQQSGNQPDFECPETGETFELKCDKYAVRNNSAAMFAEFAESVDGGTNLRASGIAKQYAICNFFLILRKNKASFEILKVPSEAFAELLDKPWQERRTASGANGNAWGRYAYGKLIPFAEIAAISVDTWVLPTDFDPLSPTYAIRAIGGAE